MKKSLIQLPLAFLTGALFVIVFLHINKPTTLQTNETYKRYEAQRYVLQQIHNQNRLNKLDSVLVKKLIDGREAEALKFLSTFHKQRQANNERR